MNLPPRVDELQRHKPHIPFLEQNKAIRLRVSSDSMCPVLVAGDIVHIRDLKDDEPRPGDIVLASHAGQWICHRMVRRDMSGGIVLKGDANIGEDDPLPEEAIVGIVHAWTKPSAFGRWVWSASSRFPRILRTVRGPRLALAELCRIAALGLEWVRPALATPEELLSSTARTYSRPNERGRLLNENETGLTENEMDLLETYGPRSGSLLVLGAGAGRESFTLAQMGYHVTAVEQDAELLSICRQYSAKHHLNITWFGGTILGGLPSGPFDGILLWGQIYELFPGRSRRIALLRECAKVIADSGVLHLSLMRRGLPSMREVRAHPWRQRLARWIGGNPDVQIGDRWQFDGIFFHEFTSAEEALEEADAAGWKPVEVCVKDDAYLVLTPQ